MDNSGWLNGYERGTTQRPTASLAWYSSINVLALPGRLSWRETEERNRLVVVLNTLQIDENYITDEFANFVTECLAQASRR